MRCLLHVVALHVWDHPQVTRVFPKRIAGVLSRPWTLEVFFSWILLRHPHRIKIEDIFVRLCKPTHGFISARETPGTVQAMLEVPDDSVPHTQTKTAKDRVQN